MLELTVINKGQAENGWFLIPGRKVEYLGHVPGGMVKIKLPDGEKTIAHPACFKELQ